MTLNTEMFILRAQQTHGNLYDYSQVEYKNMHKKVLIIDPEYGEFWQSPMGHLNGQNHPVRGRKIASEKRRKSVDAFIREAREKHGNLYDYSKVNEIINVDTEVLIIDPVYGEFWQTPYNHLNSWGCPKRTKAEKPYDHTDHIIPMSIIYSRKRQHTDWVKDRPLYIFLDSEKNKQSLIPYDNVIKGDTIILNGKKFTASSLRNNYDVILYLSKTVLGIDITDIIEEDKVFIENIINM